MGLTDVSLKIKNPGIPSKVVEGTFLVDSGATYTVLPNKYVKELDLKPSYVREFSLADGTVIKRNIGNALIEFNGEETAVPVVLGQRGDSALLGVFTLEALGLMLNPFNRKLFPAKLMM